MMPDHSFDPRTWLAAARPRTVAPLAGTATPAASEPGTPARAGWLGLALSAAILVGGAASAYAMRPADAAPIRLSELVSPGG